MPYLIDATDGPDAGALRAYLRPAHLEHITAHLRMVLAAGAKLDDAGATAQGSVFLLDVDTRAEAQTFVTADPYAAGGVYRDVVITRWRKGFFDGARADAPPATGEVSA